MLLRFGVANHKSLSEFNELNFTAAKAIKDRGPDLIEGPGQNLDVVPIALIYGANASGKSAIYDALHMMRMHVVNSFELKPDAEIPRKPFLLSEDGPTTDTHFDCDFVSNGVRYHYGYEFDDKQFKREWLYAFSGGHRRLLFNRDVANESIEFGKTLRGRNKTIEEFTRTNCLFVSAAAQGAHPLLTEIYNFFDQRIRTLNPNLNNVSVQQRIADSNDDRIVDFLRRADTGIITMRAETVKAPPEMLTILGKLRNVFQEASPETEFVGAPEERVEVSFGHSHKEGEAKYLPFADESRGTRRLAALLVDAFEAIDEGAVLVVDELDVSMHSHLSSEILGLFSDQATNPNGAQLIATTHDTHLLCSSLLRRDQIWFVEKDNGASYVYPLTDIKTRNTDNLQKGYLQGRFGAIPYLGSRQALFVDAVDG